MLLIPSNFYRIHLGLMSQLLSQWSGANSITIYAPDTFHLLAGQNHKLFATPIFGVLKFAAAIICALFLVDVIGRKQSLGIVDQFSLPCATHSASKLAAFAQRLITFDSVNSFAQPEHPEQHLLNHHVF
jgi:hypothetical protein